MIQLVDFKVSNTHCWGLFYLLGVWNLEVNQLYHHCSQQAGWLQGFKHYTNKTNPNNDDTAGWLQGFKHPLLGFVLFVGCLKCLKSTSCIIIVPNKLVDCKVSNTAQVKQTPTMMIKIMIIISVGNRGAEAIQQKERHLDKRTDKHTETDRYTDKQTVREMDKRTHADKRRQTQTNEDKQIW